MGEYVETQAERPEAGSALKSFTVEIVDGPREEVSFRLKREFHNAAPKRDSFSDPEELAHKICQMLGCSEEAPNETEEPEEETTGEQFTRPLKGR